jgi:hypothetical protein
LVFLEREISPSPLFQRGVREPDAIRLKAPPVIFGSLSIKTEVEK